MEPITREEYYLAKIAGTYKGKTPEPVTIDEYYLATMAGDYSGNTPQPVTRLQYYMAKVAGVWGGSIPAPVTRLEYYWAAIANGEGTVFPPVTREEHFLVLVADAYSVVLTVVTGNPALLENSKGNRGLESLTLYGKSTQMNTTGAQLLPFEVGEKGINFEVFEDGIALSCKKGTDIYAVGRPGPEFESSYDDFPLLAPGEYYIYSDGKYVELLVTTFVNGEYLILGVSRNGTAVKIKVIAGYKFRILIRCREDVETKVKAIISKRYPTASNYEPYTGGKPSPSQEYPQEIESVGQDGEIGVSICGGNLIDISSGVKQGYNVTQPNLKLIPGQTYTYTNVNASTDVGLHEITTNVSLTNGYLTAGISKTFVMPDIPGAKIVLAGLNNKWHKDDLSQIHFMLNIGSTALPYEPYKPVQTLHIPTPNGLPGIPVSSGGNYTDADGQQWVCDEVDFKKGVYLQRVGKRTITSKDTFFKSGLSTNDVNYFGLNNFFVHIGTAGKKDVLMSNCFVAGIYQIFGALGEIFLGGVSGNVIYFSVDVQKYPDTETFKQWAVENGLMFLYQLADIVETHLTAEELSAYKTLRTYSPTTTVINDAEAGMSVGYAKIK